ncbi:hypothetical protein HaLaN_19274, partial [Haematococcus lacustris]
MSTLMARKTLLVPCSILPSHWESQPSAPSEVRTSLTRFRCTEGVVDDAMQFIFECTATSSIREQPEFAMTLQNNNENLHGLHVEPMCTF